MTFTYDPATVRGQVRLLGMDRDQSNPIFTDAEIDAFLVVENNNVKMAAALAVDDIANSAAKTARVTQLSSIKLDGKSVAQSLRAYADSLRKQVNLERQQTYSYLQTYVDNVLDVDAIPLNNDRYGAD